MSCDGQLSDSGGDGDGISKARQARQGRTNKGMMSEVGRTRHTSPFSPLELVHDSSIGYLK